MAAAGRPGGSAHARTGGLPGRVTDIMLLGDRLELQVDTPVGRQIVVTLGYSRVAEGDNIVLSAAAENVHFVAEA